MSDEDDARRLFRSFYRYDPKPKDIVTIKQEEPETALVIGRLHGIQYKPRDQKLTAFHKFSATNRPLLLVSSDGLQIYILKGGYKFTDRGFIK